MIDAAITQVASQLNQALKRQFMSAEDLVAVSNLHEQDGTVTTQAVNKVAVFLVNVERESVPGGGSGGGGGGLQRVFSQAQAVHLNLMVMFAANFGGGNYPEALKFLSSTVSFFQSRPVFNHQNTPELDNRIDKLTLEIENLGLSDLSNLWGILSGKYLPSVLYRMRLVSIDASQITATIPRITKPTTGVGA